MFERYDVLELLAVFLTPFRSAMHMRRVILRDPFLMVCAIRREENGDMSLEYWLKVVYVGSLEGAHEVDRSRARFRFENDTRPTFWAV